MAWHIPKSLVPCSPPALDLLSTILGGWAQLAALISARALKQPVSPCIVHFLTPGRSRVFGIYATLDPKKREGSRTIGHCKIIEGVKQTGVTADELEKAKRSRLVHSWCTDPGAVQRRTLVQTGASRDLNF